MMRSPLQITPVLALTLSFLALPLPRTLASAAPPDYPALGVELSAIQDNDQKFRLQMDGVVKAHGIESPEVKELWDTISKNDHANLVRVSAILDQYGWIGPDQIGWKGNLALFLVIQHADIMVQEKYLPMMREAVRAKRAQASQLALLEDRVALGESRPQIYGSQIGRDVKGRYYVLPLSDPDHVDERRAKVGLGPLADYVKQWNIAWNPRPAPAPGSAKGN
jgi:hypothetical protein